MIYNGLILYMFHINIFLSLNLYIFRIHFLHFFPSFLSFIFFFSRISFRFSRLFLLQNSKLFLKLSGVQSSIHRRLNTAAKNSAGFVFLLEFIFVPFSLCFPAPLTLLYDLVTKPGNPSFYIPIYFSPIKTFPLPL